MSEIKRSAISSGIGELEQEVRRLVQNS